jgi:hypothetical protein
MDITRIVYSKVRQHKEFIAIQWTLQGLCIKKYDM